MLLKNYEHLLIGRPSPAQQRETDEQIQRKTVEAQDAINRLFAEQGEPERQPTRQRQRRAR